MYMGIAMEWSMHGRDCCLSLITSRINASASAACSACPQSAIAEETVLEVHFKRNWWW